MLADINLTIRKIFTILQAKTVTGFLEWIFALFLPGEGLHTQIRLDPRRTGTMTHQT